MESVRLYELWQIHDVLPYGGGWLDQPRWVVEDFENLMLLEERQRLNAQRPKADKKKTFEDS